jgi:hypothetical protein
MLFCGRGTGTRSSDPEMTRMTASKPGSKVARKVTFVCRDGALHRHAFMAAAALERPALWRSHHVRFGYSPCCATPTSIGRLSLPMSTAHAMLVQSRISRGRGCNGSQHPTQNARCRAGILETFRMKFSHLLGMLSAAAMSVALAGSAVAQNKTVKIGAVFPLSGNAASAGVHAKYAI